MRMLISSFYNTLIDKEEAIPVSTMLEIDKLRREGTLFSICTNRSKKDVLYYNHDYQFIDYIISYNGNYIYDVSKEKCIYKKPLQKTIIKKIENIFKNKEITYYKEQDITYKLEIKITNRDGEKNLINELNDLNISKSIFKFNNNYFIEVMMNNTYEGIEALSKKLKIELEEMIIVIGNSSEKEVLNNIENTYVVSNAPKEVKALSKNKTKSNNSRGVEEVIKKYNK